MGFIKYTHALSLLRVTAILITVVYPRHALAAGFARTRISTDSLRRRPILYLIRRRRRRAVAIRPRLEREGLDRRPKVLFDGGLLLRPRRLLAIGALLRLGHALLLLAHLLGARLQVLLALALALEHLLHRLLLVLLHRGQTLAQLEHVHRAVDRAGGDEAALVLHGHGEEPVVVNLQRERRVVLLVKVVPHVERAVHLGR